MCCKDLLIKEIWPVASYRTFPPVRPKRGRFRMQMRARDVSPRDVPGGAAIVQGLLRKFFVQWHTYLKALLWNIYTMYCMLYLRMICFCGQKGGHAMAESPEAHARRLEFGRRVRRRRM